MTSAPQSARYCVATAPGSKRVRSSTTISSKSIMRGLASPSRARLQQDFVVVNNYKFIELVENVRFESDYAPVAILLLLVDHFLDHVDGVPDEHRSREPQFVYAIERDPCFLDLALLNAQTGGNTEYQYPVSNTLPERTFSGVGLAHVQLHKISGEAGEVHNISLGDGSSARGADAIESEIFEVRAQVISFPLL